MQSGTITVTSNVRKKGTKSWKSQTYEVKVASTDLGGNPQLSARPNKFLVLNPLPDNSPHHLSKSPTVVLLAFVEPESLFVQIPEEMPRSHGHVASAQHSLEQRPEILDSVGMYAAFDVANGVVDRLVNVFPV